MGWDQNNPEEVIKGLAAARTKKITLPIESYKFGVSMCLQYPYRYHEEAFHIYEILSKNSKAAVPIDIMIDILKIAPEVKNGDIVLQVYI